MRADGLTTITGPGYGDGQPQRKGCQTAVLCFGRPQNHSHCLPRPQTFCLRCLLNLQRAGVPAGPGGGSSPPCGGFPESQPSRSVSVAV